MDNETLNRRKVYFRILSYLKPYWRHLIGVLITSVFFTVFSGLSIYLTIPLLETLFQTELKAEQNLSPTAELSQKIETQAKSGGFLSGIKRNLSENLYSFIDRPSKRESLLRICGLILITFFLKGLFGYVQSYLMAYIEQGFIRDLRNETFSHLNKLSLKYFTNERIGNLISRITNDITMINTGISASFVTLTKDPLLVIVFLLLALAISWQLTLLSLVVMPFSLAIISWLGVKLYKQSYTLQGKMADLTSFLQEKIYGTKIVKAFNMEAKEDENFFALTNHFFKIILRITRIRNIAPPVTEFFSILAGVLIIWYGGIQVLESHTLKASEFLGFLFIIFQIMPPIKELSNVANRIQESTAAASRVFEIIDEPITIKNKPNAIPFISFNDKIVFDKVSFHYDISHRYILKDISFEVKRGEIAALVGPSGAGKTTLVDLIPRFYDVTEGAIYIDGVDIRDYDLKSLRNHIGIVTQDPILFNDTIKNNISYGMEDAEFEEIVNAAKAANAHDFIMDLPQGYDTIIGERGLKLSGGQRQRISIARALLKNPPIMILDEATSALDSESEILVQGAIENLMKDRTTFVIAHRLSTVRNASKVIVIDEGKIVQMGTHAELIQDTDGLYYRLYSLQFRFNEVQE
ncbi:MAG: ABC transporter ATP-binding protein [Ignavibacteria bacterium]|jgi:subfamily B ATP-binding cassette protein MsbA|nr:ABC transporter ATP-binding protein [Ignavibacteria bacterium]